MIYFEDHIATPGFPLARGDLSILDVGHGICRFNLTSIKHFYRYIVHVDAVLGIKLSPAHIQATKQSYP